MRQSILYLSAMQLRYKSRMMWFHGRHTLVSSFLYIWCIRDGCYGFHSHIVALSARHGDRAHEYIGGTPPRYTIYNAHKKTEKFLHVWFFCVMVLASNSVARAL